MSWIHTVITSPCRPTPRLRGFPRATIAPPKTAKNLVEPHQPSGVVELWTINRGMHSPTLSSHFSPLVIDWLLADPAVLDRESTPPDNGIMRVDLARDVEDFLREQVRIGVCTRPDELVNDVLRSVREQQRIPFEVTPELEAWLLDSADKPSTPLKPESFEAIRQRVRARRASGAS